jgi:hypothetical protein
MKLKFAVALAVGLFATLARADSSVTITVDLGTPQLFDTPTELVIPFSGLNGTLVSGQTEMVTVLFDSGEFIEYRPPYVALNAGLVLGTSVATYPEFASGTGAFLAANGSDLFTPIVLSSADEYDPTNPDGPGEMAVGIEFPPTFTATGIYGFQFDITCPDTPGVAVTSGKLLLNVQPVPEPSSLLLSGIGLAALIGLARRYRAGGQNAPV